MFISKRKLNEMLKEREEKIHIEYRREERLRDFENYVSRRVDDTEKRLWEIEEKLNMHNKSDTTCVPCK